MARKTIEVADKPTLDQIKTNTDDLISKSDGIKETVDEIKKVIDEGGGGGASALIKISTGTASFIGETVILTGSGERKEALFDDNGEASFKVNYVGIYTATCDGVSVDIDVTAVSTIYTTELDKNYATVNVTTSSKEFILQSVECIDKSTGTTVKKATINIAKTAAFRLTKAGTYTFRISYDGKEYSSKEVIISASDISENKILETKINCVLIWGFVETFATKDPEKRITYCDENENYKPMTMKSNGSQDYGDWVDWDLLKENLPYMVKSNGIADYQLDPNDYTKKAAGGSSDVSNTSYAGGAFSWLKKVYVKETYDSNKTYRKVEFTFDNSSSETADFEAYAFKWDKNTELEGLWLPMFYMSDTGKTVAGPQPIYGKTTDQERSIITGFSARACHLGGPVMQLLRDLAYLLCKSTDIQTHWGEGCMSAYNASGSPTYGVKPNAVVGGGQFYGCSGGTTLNKAFHSIAIQSFQQLLRDPMTLLSNGKMLVSKYYSLYSLTGAEYTDTGYTFATSSTWRYATKLQPVPGFGSVHQDDNEGTTATSCCDGQYYNASGVRVAHRLGGADVGLIDGPACLHLNHEASFAYWACGVAVLLCPSAGYAPA